MKKTIIGMIAMLLLCLTIAFIPKESLHKEQISKAYVVKNVDVANGEILQVADNAQTLEYGWGTGTIVVPPEEQSIPFSNVPPLYKLFGTVLLFGVFLIALIWYAKHEARSYMCGNPGYSSPRPIKRE